MSKSIRVLYVDDNPFDRELVRDALEMEDGGFDLITVASQARIRNGPGRGRLRSDPERFQHPGL